MKNTLTLVALLSVGGFASAAGEDSGPGLKGVAAALFATAGVKYGLDRLGKVEGVKEAADNINIGTQDIANVAGITSGLLLLGYMSKGENQQQFYHFAKYAPLAAVISYVTSTQTFRDIAKNLPVLGDYLACKNDECQGRCKDCLMTQGMVGIGTYALIRGWADKPADEV